jgi:hypothetical protein
MHVMGCGGADRQTWTQAFKKMRRFHHPKDPRQTIPRILDRTILRIPQPFKH